MLVTRPEPGAKKTADMLRRTGHEPVVLPLSRTVTLTDNGGDLNRVAAAAVAVTSAAALRHWTSCGIDPARLDLPFFAVGDATGEAARELGFRDVQIGGGTGGDLAASIIEAVATNDLQLSQQHPLLYAAGRVRHGELEAAIVAADLPLEVVEIYDTEEISYSTDYFLRQFLPHESVAALFYSRNAAALFFTAFDNADTDKRLENWVFLCMSDQVAAAVPRQFETRTHVAGAPREKDLFALLDDVSQSR